LEVDHPLAIESCPPVVGSHRRLGDLGYLGGPMLGAVGIGFRPIARHDLHPRMRLKSLRQGLRLTIGPQGDRLSSFQVNQHGTIDLPLPIGPVVDSEHLGCGKAWRARSRASVR
jgi:hypothetical protein